LEKIIEDEDLNQKIRKDLIKFAEEKDTTSVKLVKKREEEQ
jgi:hypothetical protein